VKKIIFWGDGILSGPCGYAELLRNHVFLHHPRAFLSLPAILSSTPASSGEGITSASGGSLAEALRDAPLHAIGKDPDLLYLGFGYADLKAGRSAEEILRHHRDLIALITQKTRAHLVLPLVITAFFSGEEGARAQIVNQGFRMMASPRVTVLDLDREVEAFLAEHRESPGDQQALHFDSGRLTPLGQLFLAHRAYGLTPWPELDLAPASEAARV
jgi:hypothetical protein